MGTNTAIGWTDHTFNPWIGCTEVSTAATGGGGCDLCYARELSRRYGWAKWGPGEPRHRTSPSTWRKVMSWQNQAPEFFASTDRRQRVFCASLADIFDNEVDQSWRADLWALVKNTEKLQWQLLTKRIGNAAKMLPADWPYPNAGLMGTMINQPEFDRDWPKLRDTPASWRGISMEPLLGPINIGDARPDWIIVGGESGKGARPMHPSWARSLRDQCAAAGIPYFFKQWGEHHPDGQAWADGTWGLAETPGEPIGFGKVGKKKSGRLLDGVEHNGFPA